MSPKRKNPKLPHRVTLKHGAYYYLKPVIKNGKSGTQWVRLGKTEPEMYKALASMRSDGEGVMAAVIRRYRREELPKKAENTIKAQERQLDRISKAFGHMRPCDIRPSHIAQYHDLIGSKAPYMANRELALITHVLKYAVRWGYIDENPAREIQRHPEKPRDRYIGHDEYATVRDAAPGWIGILMDLAYLTGQRRTDLFNIKRSDMTVEGIYIRQSKTGAKLLIDWTPDLETTVKRAIEALHGEIESIYLICDGKGQKRRDAAFTTAWSRLMGKCVKQGLIQNKFQFRDIRAKAGSDSTGEQLGHRSKATLNRHYKRLPKRVKPTQ